MAAHSRSVETANQLIQWTSEQGVQLPIDISVEQMANLRIVTVKRRLYELPFELLKIDESWFIDQVTREDLRAHLKRGDRLLIIQKTLLSDRIEEKDILQLIRFSQLPLIFWVTWDPDPFLKYLISSRQKIDEQTCINAKAYLLQTRSYDQISLYDRLAMMLSHSLHQSSEDSSIRFIQYPILESNLRSADTNAELPIRKIHRQLLQSKPKESLRPNDFVMKAVPSMIDLAHSCADAGYGISMNEMILLWPAMKKLNNRIKCEEMKFWGKIFGLCCDYYIVQVLHTTDIPDDEIDILSLPQVRPKKNNDTPKPMEISAVTIPMEPYGTGTNRYIYFVCNAPGLPWMKLPHVTPTMIDYARKIRSFFTGCLSATIDGYGPEKNYLRAQIARISATTHISPAGFYILSNDDEEVEEEENNVSSPKPKKNATVLINEEFNTDPDNQITSQSLANKELQEWVHSLPEILPQGRTQYWRPESAFSTDVSVLEDDETIEEQYSIDLHRIQIPAPLLQPINEDKMLHTNQPPWSIGLTMSTMQEYSSCCVRSNRWPGAITLGDARQHINIYVGWGQKNESFHPPIPFEFQKEYSFNPIEVNDPTVEQERRFEQALHADSTLGDLTSSGDIESESEID